MPIGALFTETMADMTAVQIEASVKRGAGVLRPIGVMETHGPHLPTGTDAFIAIQICRLTKAYAAELGRELVIAPPFSWGITGVLADFAGSSMSGRKPPDISSTMSSTRFWLIAS